MCFRRAGIHWYGANVTMVQFVVLSVLPSWLVIWSFCSSLQSHYILHNLNVLLEVVSVNYSAEKKKARQIGRVYASVHRPKKSAKTEVKSGLSVQISQLLSLQEESSRCTNMPASSCVIVHEKSPEQSVGALVAEQSEHSNEGDESSTRQFTPSKKHANWPQRWHRALQTCRSSSYLSEVRHRQKIRKGTCIYADVLCKWNRCDLLYPSHSLLCWLKQIHTVGHSPVSKEWSFSSIISFTPSSNIPNRSYTKTDNSDGTERKQSPQ